MNYRLREIDNFDLEFLRKAKNDHKGSFFLKEDITMEQQKKWYQSFANREEDHMYVVEQKVNDSWEPIGCMGYRILDDEHSMDLYNIIRVKRVEPTDFTMADVFQNMIANASKKFPHLPIQCKVLSHNPAIAWYEKNNFKIIEENEGYVLMDMDKKLINTNLNK